MGRSRRSRLAFARRLLVAALAVSGAACGAAPGAEDASGPSGASEIARVHRSKCGACHVRVEPGQRTRAQIEAALARHHRRVHLRDAQWQEMLDYLAPEAAQTSSPTP